MRRGKGTSGWCIQFWDWDAWNVMADTTFRYKQQAIDLANKMNRETDHATRVGSFGGHRFRVRWDDGI